MPKLHKECFQGGSVCVCVCTRERERQRPRETERERMYMCTGRSVVKFSGDSDKHWFFF